MLINSSLFSWQYLDGYTAKAAIHKAKANCGERNVQNLAKATGRKRKRAPPPNSNKKMQKGRRKSFNLHPDQTESKAVDDLGLTRERHDAFKKATLMLRDSQLARERAGGMRPRGCKSAATIVKEPAVSTNTATTADQVDVGSMTCVEKRALLAKLHDEMNKE